MNGDFADVVSYPPKNYKGIVALQVRSHVEVLNHLMARLTGYLRIRPEMEHYRGKLPVVKSTAYAFESRDASKERPSWCAGRSVKLRFDENLSPKAGPTAGRCVSWPGAA